MAAGSKLPVPAIKRNSAVKSLLLVFIRVLGLGDFVLANSLGNQIRDLQQNESVTELTEIVHQGVLAYLWFESCSPNKHKIV